MDSKTKFAFLALTASILTGIAVADSYFTIEDGFVFEGYQIMDENRNSIIEYDSGDDELDARTDINMQENQLNEFFDSACPSGKVMADVNNTGGLTCVEVEGEVSGDFVSRDGDSMEGNLDMKGSSIEDINDLKGENIINSSNIESSAVGEDEIESSAVTSNELDESGNYGLDWSNLDISKSDVSKGDVGLGDVENIALSSAGWSDIDISQSDVLSTANDLDGSGNIKSNSVGEDEIDQSSVGCSGGYC